MTPEQHLANLRERVTELENFNGTIGELEQADTVLRHLKTIIALWEGMEKLDSGLKGDLPITNWVKEEAQQTLARACEILERK